MGRRFGSRRCTSLYIYGSGKLTRVVGSLYKNLREISLFQVQDVTNQDSAAKPRQTFKITFTTKPHHVTSSPSTSFTSSHVSTTRPAHRTYRLLRVKSRLAHWTYRPIGARRRRRYATLQFSAPAALTSDQTLEIPSHVASVISNGHRSQVQRSRVQVLP